MCTLSWALEAKGYRLFFNRDEARDRAVGEPPRVWSEAGGEFLGPRDPQGEGTWIGVNAAGWTTAVLNLYGAGVDRGAGKRSRGLIVRELAPQREAGAAEAFLGSARLRDYAPFHLVRVSPGGEGIRYSWDGSELTVQEALEQHLPLTTSSFQTERVVARRRSIFGALNAAGKPTAETLASFHRYFDPSDGAASVCMRREDAETVSLSEICVGPKIVSFTYYVRQVERGGFEPPVRAELPRAKPGK
ncbi:MAG: NRDE family protein [Verrucomicrobiota bacterium]